jgi:hypothetical protein
MLSSHVVSCGSAICPIMPSTASVAMKPLFGVKLGRFCLRSIIWIAASHRRECGVFCLRVNRHRGRRSEGEVQHDGQAFRRRPLVSGVDTVGMVGRNAFTIQPSAGWWQRSEGRIDAAMRSSKPSSCCPGPFRREPPLRNKCRSCSIIYRWWPRGLLSFP